MTATDPLRAITPDYCWDSAIGMPFRWEMPDSDRGFAVETDDDGDVYLTTGAVWVSRYVATLSADEARWLRDVWPAVLQAVDAYTGSES